MSESSKDLVIQLAAFVLTVSMTVLGIGMSSVLVAYAAKVLL